MFVRRLHLLLALGCALVALLVLTASLALTASAAPQSTTCSSNFRVQHDDRIGPLVLPAGNYEVRVDGLSCSSAFGLLPTFLADYDGRLPDGWRVTDRGSGEGLFRRGKAALAVTSKPNGGTDSPSTNLDCPSRFLVVDPNPAGEVELIRGAYRITRLSRISPTCRAAAQLLKGFLGRNTQQLPGGWTSFRDDGAFIKGSATYGFRVDPY